MIGGEVVVEKNPSQKYCIAEKEPLCDSIIWELLQNYYKKAAINAWKENVVPSFVTSNSKLAKDYARVIVNYMRDWFNSNECDRNVPIYILEIGAGHGKFTYLILRALSKYKKYFKSMNIPDNPFVYVFTDIARDNINYCMNNDRLKRFINSKDSCGKTCTSKNNSYYDSENEKNEIINCDTSTNSSIYSSSYNETNYSDEKMRNNSSFFSMLDFAFFDGNDTSEKIYLEVTKKYIPHDTPIVLICNYVLDSLLTDAWIVCGENHFKRALLSIYTPNKEEEKTNADIMLRMSVTWDWEDINIDEEIKKKKTTKPSDYLRTYQDIYTVLKLYACFNQNLSFVLPVGAFILFKRILKLSNNKLLCLIGDKGYQSYEEFRGYRDPHIVVHGSLSFMVNLNAICLFFLSLGGYYIYTPYSDTFQIVTLLIHKKSEDVQGEKSENTSAAQYRGNMPQVENLSIVSSGSMKKKKEFCIVDYFKESTTGEFQKEEKIKSDKERDRDKERDSDKERDKLIFDKWGSKSKIQDPKIFSKRCTNAESVYKKMKKINLKNLNNMTIKFGSTIASFSDNMEQFPPDILISWQKAVIQNINYNPANVNIKELIALLRYSNYDSDVFFNIRSAFTNLACFPNINGRTEKDILFDIKECYDNYYSLKNDEDIADVCGHICMKFGEFETSIFYLKESLRNFKHTRHSSTYINIASCYKVLRNYGKSLKFIKSAIKLANRESVGSGSGGGSGSGSGCSDGRGKKSTPPNNVVHSYDLLYNIQFCLNPITYAIVGLNYYVQNDGLYYLSFESKIKLKYIFLLAKEEESVLKFMHTKYKHATYEKSNRNMDLTDVKIVRVFEDNMVLSLQELLASEEKQKCGKVPTKGALTHTEMLARSAHEGIENIPYSDISRLKKKLSACLEQYSCQFCVVDAPWLVKSSIVELLIDKCKNIFTYGTLSNSSMRSFEVILKYKAVASHVSWINNNYIHDECLYEAKEALNHIKEVTSLTVTHYSTNLFYNQNDGIASADILTDDLCSILNMLQIILGYNITGVTANFVKKGTQEKVSSGLGSNSKGEIECGMGNDKESCEPKYACLSGIVMFSQQQGGESEQVNIFGNYLLMNNRNEEFITKINIVGMLGCLCLKKTLSNWSVHIFNIDGEKIFDKSGRIATSQNSNDVFINQYLIKTDGKNNNIKHYNEYDLKASCKDSTESIDSDVDILEVSSDEEGHTNGMLNREQNETHNEDMNYEMKKKKNGDASSPNELSASVQRVNSSRDNHDEVFMDKNLENLKDIPGKRFYSAGKEIYENINLDENLIDITVNNNCFYSRIVEGINMSHKKGGVMVHFRYDSTLRHTK
ncbi:conserved Plasmodium protein, unknown function [Plasmodium ovale]|uniref:Tetratricopeptide repeat protein n=1 Tax=Plasmodium ovale TaxID=36330 RepID=A0A1C3KUC0_PLAOA|nr:conserved Plasmodium protein, unknown function [Plasmodium ovale]